MSTPLRVGPKRIISIRYTMTNNAGNILVDTPAGSPVRFLFGSGEIIPELEGPLQGLKKGEKKEFSLSEKDAPGLNENYHFHVTIEDVEWASDAMTTGDSGRAGDCGPGCAC